MMMYEIIDEADVYGVRERERKKRASMLLPMPAPQRPGSETKTARIASADRIHLRCLWETQMKTDQLDNAAVYASLRSKLCPACGGEKKRLQTLCLKDYCSLSKSKQRAVYRKIGDGYVEAVRDALSFLGVQEPHLPEMPAAAVPPAC